MFDQSTVDAVRGIAARLNVPASSLLAVAEVESAGKATAMVNGKPEPLIRFEGHYFDKRLTGSIRDAARRAGLASPKTGGVKNPNSQAARWALLNRAMALDANAALESVSWGVGQVMGANWKDLGFKSVVDLVDTARRDVAGQVEVMARFIEKNGLAAVLRAGNWPVFARRYNGPGYKANKYDTKMAAASARWEKKLQGAGTVKPSKPADPAPTPITSMAMSLGDKGPLVEELQKNLDTLDYYSGPINGEFDDATEEAVKAFQAHKKLKADGIVGLRTSKALADALTAPKLEEAKRNIPPTAPAAVKEKTGLWQWLVGIAGSAGAGLTGLFGAPWQTVVAVGGLALVFLVVVFFMRRQIVEAFKEINAGAAQ